MAALLTGSFIHKHGCVPSSGLVTGSPGSSAHLLPGFELSDSGPQLSSTRAQDTAASQKYNSVLLYLCSSRPLKVELYTKS